MLSSVTRRTLICVLVAIALVVPIASAPASQSQGPRSRDAHRPAGSEADGGRRAHVRPARPRLHRPDRGAEQERSRAERRHAAQQGRAQGRSGCWTGSARAVSVRSPVHGMPVLLKDLIDVKGMYTSNGNYSLRNSFPEKDSGVAEKLRERGAVILGKVGLSEYANFFGNQPSGFANLTGQVINAIDADQNVSGSSSGSGAAVRGGAVAADRRHRDVGLDHQPVAGRRHRRPAPHRRPRPRRRHRPDLGLAGHGRPDGPDGRERGADADGDRRPGSREQLRRPLGPDPGRGRSRHPAGARHRARLPVGARPELRPGQAHRLQRRPDDREPAGADARRRGEGRARGGRGDHGGAPDGAQPAGGPAAVPEHGPELRGEAGHQPLLRQPRPARADQLAGRGDRRQQRRVAPGAQVRQRHARGRQRDRPQRPGGGRGVQDRPPPGQDPRPREHRPPDDQRHAGRSERRLHRDPRHRAERRARRLPADHDPDGLQRDPAPGGERVRARQRLHRAQPDRRRLRDRAGDEEAQAGLPGEPEHVPVRRHESGAAVRRRAAAATRLREAAAPARQGAGAGLLARDRVGEEPAGAHDRRDAHGGDADQGVPRAHRADERGGPGDPGRALSEPATPPGRRRRSTASGPGRARAGRCTASRCCSTTRSTPRGYRRPAARSRCRTPTPRTTRRSRPG